MIETPHKSYLVSTGSPVSSVVRVAGKYLASHPLWWVDSVRNRKVTYGGSTEQVHPQAMRLRKLRDTHRRAGAAETGAEPLSPQ